MVCEECPKRRCAVRRCDALKRASNERASENRELTLNRSEKQLWIHSHHWLIHPKSIQTYRYWWYFGKKNCIISTKIFIIFRVPENWFKMISGFVRVNCESTSFLSLRWLSSMLPLSFPIAPCRINKNYIPGNKELTGEKCCSSRYIKERRF